MHGNFGENSQNCSVLILTYGKDECFKKAIVSQVLDVLGSCHISLVDNSERETGGDPNRYYEFTGYLKLVENYTGNSQYLIIMNDTAFTHHSTCLWLMALRDVLTHVVPGKIYGDARNSSRPYLASWLFLVHRETLPVFVNILKESICSVSVVERFYNMNTLNCYASNLNKIEKQQLVKWLFSDSIFGAWIYAQSFEDMPPETRYRKGVCIAIEHNISRLLPSKGLVDIKRVSKRAMLANFFDRVLNKAIRLKWMIVN